MTDGGAGATGSPVTVDDVLSGVRARLPDVRIERLQVSHPADDDNLWSTAHGGSASRFSPVQIETHTGGLPPFLIEGDGAGQRYETSGADEAVDVILEWLGPAS
jgi:hypothetical protein